MTESNSEPATAFFSHGTYDRLKFIAQIILPALGTLYFAIGSIWGLSHTTQVVGSITAFDLFLGTILQLASNSYYNSGANFDGTIRVTDTPEKTTHTLELNGDPAELANKSSVTFNVDKVNKHEAPE